MNTIDWSAIWGVDLQVVTCEHCDSAYLLPPEVEAHYCPNCYKDKLDAIQGGTENLAYTQPPELVLPFAIDDHSVMGHVERFAKKIPFRPRDLKPETLRGRLRRVYLPMWLVDSDVRATWQAETGFYYDTVSHRERLDGGSWRSHEVKEQRTRWGPRAGRLVRRYENIAAPALEGFGTTRQQIGEHRLEGAIPYNASAINGVFVRLPNRQPTDAWPDAMLGFQTVAAEECRRASRADRIRKYQWSAEYQTQNWTQLLLPIYTTYYLDDENVPRVVLINGQSGQTGGERRASMKRAQSFALVAGGIALSIFICSLAALMLVLDSPLATALGLLGLVLAIVTGVAGLVPVVQVSRFNRDNPY